MKLMLRRACFAAVVIVLIVVVRLFPDQNQTLVDIDLLLTQIEGVRLWLALAATFVLGGLLAGLFSCLLLIRSSLVGRRYRSAIADLEAEVHHLRNLPLASAGHLIAGDDPIAFDDEARGASTVNPGAASAEGS